MNEEHVKGKAKEVEGAAQRKWGEVTNDPEDRIKGAAKEGKGKARQQKGDLKDAAKRKS